MVVHGVVEASSVVAVEAAVAAAVVVVVASWAEEGRASPSGVEGGACEVAESRTDCKTGVVDNRHDALVVVEVRHSNRRHGLEGK